MNELAWILIENYNVDDLLAWAKQDRGAYEIAQRANATVKQFTIREISEALDCINNHVLPTVVDNDFNANTNVGG